MKIGPQPDSTFWNIRESLISCCGGLSRLTVSFNRFQILKFSCLAEFGLRKGMQMVNTVLEDQKLLIQYLSNISWSHSFTKYKQPISIMHWTQYSKRWPWLQWWGEQAAFGLRWYQSGHHDIGGYAVCTLVVECAHWLWSVHIGCCAARTLCTLVASDCQRVTLPTTGPCNSALSQVPRPTCWCIVGQGMTLQLTVTYTAPHAYLAAVTIVVNTLCVRLWMANLPTWSDLNKWLLTSPTTSDYTWSNHGMFTAGVIYLVGPNIDRVPAWLVDLKK